MNGALRIYTFIAPIAIFERIHRRLECSCPETSHRLILTGTTDNAGQPRRVEAALQPSSVSKGTSSRRGLVHRHLALESITSSQHPDHVEHVSF